MNTQYPRFGTNTFEECKKKIGDFIVDMKSLLGKGTFGEVYICWREQNPTVKYACKIIPIANLQQDELKQSLEEGRLLMIAQGNNIVPMITFIRSSKNFYYITQYCNQGNLLDFIKKNQANVNEGFILNIFKMICVGYYEQIFSTPMYASPQIFLLEEECKYSYKTDIYSLGVMLYQLIYQYVPGKPQTKQDVTNFMKKLKEKGTQCINFPQNSNFQVSFETKQAIRSMMEFREENRISIEELLNHKMFKLIEMEDNNQYQENDEISQSIQKSLIGLKRRGIQVTKIQSIKPLNQVQNVNTKESSIEEVDQYYLFIRNSAIFSKITLSNLYHIYQEFKSIGILEINLDYILMALQFHYKLALEFCRDTIDQEAPKNVPYNSNYKLSNQYQFTKSSIIKEYEEAEKQNEFLRNKIIQKINDNYNITYQNNEQLKFKVQELSKFLLENQNLNSVITAYKKHMKQYFIKEFELILKTLSNNLKSHKTFLQIILSLCIIHSQAMSINNYNKLEFNEFYQQFALPSEHLLKLIELNLKNFD
ncbi:hypothetical protein ABPG72_001592 [Tetrahymena utriculariae]